MPSNFRTVVVTIIFRVHIWVPYAGSRAPVPYATRAHAFTFGAIASSSRATEGALIRNLLISTRLGALRPKWSDII